MWRPRARPNRLAAARASRRRSIRWRSLSRQLVIQRQVVSLWHQGDTCLDVVDELLEELPSCVHGADWRFGIVTVTAGIAGGR